jgi:type I restriction enzyme R subunit
MITEQLLEQFVLTVFEGLGYRVVAGSDLVPSAPGIPRESYDQVILRDVLAEAVRRINPALSDETRAEALRRLSRYDMPSLVANNRAFHRLLVEGVALESRRSDGTSHTQTVGIVDFDHPDRNDWTVANQFIVSEGAQTRRLDIVVFLNGLPIAVFELKNPLREGGSIWDAINQLQTYKALIPSLYAYNEALVVSDGLNARVGSLTADHERFLPWKTLGKPATEEQTTLPPLRTLVEGLFQKTRALDFLRYYVLFEDDARGTVLKRLAAYHQVHAVDQAILSTVRAVSPSGDRRAGVVWHTQGSGKSLTMVFYTGRVVLHPAMENPTVVVLTDRLDLDDQLFATFSRCSEVLRQNPVQAQTRADLRRLLQVASGGIVFTTIQKFLVEEADGHSLLSGRRNIVVIADEAHRSQYDFIDGYARHMRDALPNASFLGFTGTPIETSDASTRAVFGDYVSVYDVQRAVDDGATVPIYYESRLAKLELDESERPRLEFDFEAVTETEEVEHKEELKAEWTSLAAVAGAAKRVELVARDIIDHYEKRTEAIEGKAMIVCMSRRICVDLYNAIVRHRPDWHSESDDAGEIKVVMTGSADDPVAWQSHIRSKGRRESLARRFRDPDDRLNMVIVRDMWLTGFDAPSLHTMYLDKPMHGHSLMQAIARVNRVYKDKPGGLVVDYLGLADEVRRALATYTESGGRGRAAIDQGEAIAIMLEKYEVCRAMFFGFDYSRWRTADTEAKLAMLPSAQEHVLAQEDGRSRFTQAVSELSKAFALAVPSDAALGVRDDVAFFQSVRAALIQTSRSERRSRPDVEHAIKQIVSRAIASDEVIDLFAAAGLRKPDVSVLSDEFLSEVRGMPQRNLAVEVLQRLLRNEIRAISQRHLVKGRSFIDMLERSVRAYQNRAIETVQVIDELIEIARELRLDRARGGVLGLTDEELAFYDALDVHDTAVSVLGDEALRTIARELLQTIRRNLTIDWTVREPARARLRVLVKRLLRKHGYPPDKQEAATQTVIQQAELLADAWSEPEPARALAG